jgi:hypothetical protein
MSTARKRELSQANPGNAISQGTRSRRGVRLGVWSLLSFAAVTIQCGRATMDLLPSETAGSPSDAGQGGGGANGGAESGGTSGVAGESVAGRDPGGRGGQAGSGQGNGGEAGENSCGDSSSTVCNKSLCDPCEGPWDCRRPTPFCNDGWCVGCLSDEDCPPSDVKLVCDPYNRCTPACGDGRGCPMGRPACRDETYCGQCRENKDCIMQNALGPICHFEQCVECLSDCQCAALFNQNPEGLTCLLGRCGCRGNNDCPEGWTCNGLGGECVKR